MNSTKAWMTVLTVALFLSARPAAAQYTDYLANSGNSLTAAATARAWRQVFNPVPPNPKGNARNATSAVASGQPSQAVKAAGPNTLKFNPTGTYIKTREFADNLGNTPAEREQYFKLMNGVLDAFSQRAQKVGLQNDLALALSYFLGENVRIYRGLPDFSDQQYLALRNGIAEALVSNGAVKNLTDRQKQEMYEALVAHTGVTQFGYEQGIQAKNDAIIKGYQKVAGQNLQSVTMMSPEEFNLQ